LSGVTTIDANINDLALAIKMIGPDKVHVYTVSRPPVEEFAMTEFKLEKGEALCQEEMEQNHPAKKSEQVAVEDQA
jgi:wyosine [tRNA(Phe)-imidazoG37] synthetase (radical SAM superfamily)